MGRDTWQFRDIVIPNVALNAVAGRPKEEYGLEPQGLDEIRPGCYNVDERVKDMNAGGILGSMCFPSFPGFAGRLFATEDPEFSLALVQAYNDWHVEEWCGAYPARFIPMTLPVIWDAEACAAEVRRNAKRGVHSLTFSENPAAMGYPSFHDDYWKPLWEALVDTDTVLNVHIGSSGRLAITAAGCADGCDDHAAADEHRAGRGGSVVVQADQGVPRPQDRAVRGRHRLDSVFPGARGSHLRDALDVDGSGLRRAEALARCSAITS